jgi:hypothetical protein
MLHVQCPGCLTSAYLECTCPPGHVDAAGAHQDGCTHADVDAAVRCPEGSSCCQEDHHHGQAANACPADHDGACHVDNPDCAVCRPLVITVMPGTTIQTVGG